MSLVPADAHCVVLALMGAVGAECESDVLAKGRALLDFPHVSTLIVDLRAAVTIDTAGYRTLRNLHHYARTADKSVRVQSVPPHLAAAVRRNLPLAPQKETSS